MTMVQQGFDLESGDSFREQSGPVTCLGISFENDEARRAHFTEDLRKKLQDPEFRKIEGFPIGSDEDILNLSDPPYYTACPNPWIADFIAEWEKSKPQMNTDEHRSEAVSVKVLVASVLPRLGPRTAVGRRFLGPRRQRRRGAVGAPRLMIWGSSRGWGLLGGRKRKSGHAWQGWVASGPERVAEVMGMFARRRPGGG